MASAVVLAVTNQYGFYFFVLGYFFSVLTFAVKFIVSLLSIFEKEVHFGTCRFHVKSDKLVGIALLLR